MDCMKLYYNLYDFMQFVETASMSTLGHGRYTKPCSRLEMLRSKLATS